MHHSSNPPSVAAEKYHWSNYFSVSSQIKTCIKVAMASSILCSRRFLPLFVTQFLGALNDNFFKTALVILITYRASDQLNINPQTLITIAGAMFVFPYMLFCASAGKLADKYDKAQIARLIKYAELGFMVLATIGFIFHLISVLFVVLFCMGTHSAFFSPVKYALLPDHLKESELMEGNAYIEAGTFIAILLGTIAGGLLILAHDGPIIVSCIALTLAILGILSSRFIPPATECDPTVRVRLNIFSETKENLAYAFSHPPLRKTMIANSWFWFVGMTFLTQFPAFTRLILGANEDVVTIFLTTFSVGIGVGAIACGMLLKGKISTHYVPISGFIITLFTIDLYFATKGLPTPSAVLFTPSEFFARFDAWRLVGDMFMIATAGGLFVVPLYTLLQQQSSPEYRAQVMAGNNILNAVFMVMSSVLALILFVVGLSVVDVFLVVGLLNGAYAIWLYIPQGKLLN